MRCERAAAFQAASPKTQWAGRSRSALFFALSYPARNFYASRERSVVAPALHFRAAAHSLVLQSKLLSCNMRDLNMVFASLARSRFRSRFRLGTAELAYLKDRGLPVILTHAADFVAKRLATAEPANDGKQTPMRGHPVFIAQHATATCCRSCLHRWHAIPKGRPLTQCERSHIIAAIARWLEGTGGKPIL